MSMRALGHTLTAALAVVAFGAAGCGSKKSSSTSTSAPKSAPAKSSSSGKASPSGGAAVTTKKYKAGQFCSTKKEAIYMSQHLTCKNKHLKKA